MRTKNYAANISIKFSSISKSGLNPIHAEIPCWIDVVGTILVLSTINYEILNVSIAFLLSIGG